MKKIFTLIVCLYCWALSGHAQTNFQPGLVVTIAGDTLRGFINHREWLRNPEEITFKTNLSTSSEQKFTPINSRYIEINGLEAYKAEKVNISLASLELSRLPLGVDTTYITDTVFLKVVYAGPKVSLFSYNDKLKERLYIYEAGSNTAPQELIYRKFYIQVGKQFVTSPLYRNQIWDLAVKYNLANVGFKRRVESSFYNKPDLLQLIEYLNDSAAPSAISYLKTPKTRFFVGAWLNRTSISYEGRHEFSDNATSTASYLPGISLGFDVFANPNTQRLLIKTELSVTMAEPQIEKNSLNGQSNYSYKQLKVSLNPQILFNIYNGNKFKYHVGAGLIASYSSYSLNQYRFQYSPDQVSIQPIVREDYEVLQDIWYSFTLRTGLTWNNKIDISLLFTPNDVTSNRNYVVRGNSYNLGVSYLFTRK